jgi:hypothetical protein
MQSAKDLIKQVFGLPKFCVFLLRLIPIKVRPISPRKNAGKEHDRVAQHIFCIMGAVYKVLFTKYK